MKHGSLFSGIGGFDLAAQWMGWENIFHCEWDKKCQALLKKRFPTSIGYGDIKETDFKIYANTIDIISGGFPCQPFSTAGKRKGTEDDRHLWPEMLRAIREIQPSWVVGENVYGLINWSDGLVFEQVQVDLENEGYEVWTVILPACSVNAPHRRDRIWFIAYSRQAKPQGWQQSAEGQQSSGGRQAWNKLTSSCFLSAFTNSENGGFQIGDGKQIQNGAYPTIERYDSFLQWKDFPSKSPICGGNDGISNRVDRLKQLGNAIVPQVAYQIFKTIEQYESLFSPSID